jgi:t-SNARE complex subunit (syntaxin)
MEALEMERPMTEWNDDRLDELNERVKEGFAEVDERFDKVDERFIRLENEMRAGFTHADRRLNAAFEQINARVDRIYYAILVAAVGVIGALLANGLGG